MAMDTMVVGVLGKLLKSESPNVLLCGPVVLG